MQESAITAKGQTTIPRAIREALGVTAGDRVRYVVEGNEVRLLKVGSILDLEGSLHRPGRPAASLEEMDEGIAAAAAREAGIE